MVMTATEFESDQNEYETDMLIMNAMSDVILHALSANRSRNLWAAWMPNIYEQMVDLFGPVLA